MAKTDHAGASPLTGLDKLIMRLFPKRGLSRIMARRQANIVMQYDAATRGRRSSGWRAPATSGDAAGHANGARSQMRNLARDFVRNRPFAHRGVQVIVGNVVGTGVLPSIETESEAARASAALVVREHLMTPAIDAMGQHNLKWLQRVAMAAVVQDGEVLLRRRWRRGRFAADLVLPFQVEILEADYLNDTLTKWGDNVVREGVEYGPTGRIEAYHLFREHPGTVGYLQFQRASERVPAADIVHLRKCDRPGQTRGVSWFAPVMLTLGDLSDYQEAEILKQKIAALMAGFITSEHESDGVPVDSDAEADMQGLAEIGPGTLTALPPGKDVKFTTPPKIEGYDQFMRQNLAAVAMGLGITYESLAGDLSNVNFSSGRMGRMEMDRNVEAWQQEIVIDIMCRGIERWIKEAWLLRIGQLGSPDFTMNWTAPRRALIDPTKEIPAILKKVEGGLSSLQREQRQLGLDPDVIERERVEDTARAGAPSTSAMAEETSAPETQT